MRVYSNLAANRMATSQSLAGWYKVVLLTRAPSAIAPDTHPSLASLLADIGYQELVDSHYTVPAERPLVQVPQTTTGGVTDVLIATDITLPADVPPTYITAVAFYWHGTDAAGTGATLNGVLNPWIMITDETFGQIVYPGSVLTTVAQSPKKLWSFVLRGPVGGPYVADITSTGLIRTPGTIAWEPPRTQHVYLYPQRINYVPNPSFEDLTGPNFGWRANGTLTRVIGGVDNVNKYYGHVVGTRLESVPSVITSRFFCISAYVRSAPTSGVRLLGGSGDYIVGPDIAAFAGATSITAEVDCSLDAWKPATTQSLVGQYAGTGTLNSWEMAVNNTVGTVGMSVSGDGLVAGQSMYTSTTPTLTNGTRHTIRAEWLAVDGANSSTQFKVDGVNQGAKKTNTTLPAGPFNTTWPVALGARANGTPATRLIGTVYGAKIWANGVLVASPDFTNMLAGQTTVTDVQGNVWTLNGAAAVTNPVVDAPWVQMGLCNWNTSWTQTEDVLSEQKPLVDTWTRHYFIALVPDNLAGSGALFVSNGAMDVDMVMLEQGADLNDYFDGDSKTGILGDFSWQGVTHQSLSFWYNNKYLVGARLFGAYQNGVIQQTGLVYDWVPAGTSINTHWDVLSVNDTRQPMVDFASRFCGPRALSLPGTAGNYVSTPDAAKFDITGDICLMARITPQVWTGINQTIVGKWASGGTLSYEFHLGSTGQLVFQYSANGSSQVVAASGLHGLTGTWRVAVTFDVDAGASTNSIKFWKSQDGATWTQVGTTVTTGGVITMFSGTSPVEIGSNNGGLVSLYNGLVHDVRIYNGIGDHSKPGLGTLVGHFNATQPITGATYTDELNNVWTINGGAWSFVPGL